MRFPQLHIDDCPNCIVEDIRKMGCDATIIFCDFHLRLQNAYFEGKILAQRLAIEMEIEK